MEDEATAAHLLKWRWGTHVVRMDQKRLAVATTVWDPRTGRRNRGWPRYRWLQDIETVVETNWMVLARDRMKWKETLKDLSY